MTQRIGNDLHMVLDDSSTGKPQLIVEDYFSPNQNSALATQGSDGELVLFAAESPQQTQNIAEPNQAIVQTAKGADASWLSSPGVQLAMIAGGLYAISSARNKSSDSAQPAQDSIVAYANGVAQASTPTEATYKDAGYTGVTTSNVGAINSAIQRTHTKDSAGIQKVITVYQKLIDKANGNTADTTTNDPTLSDYQTLGIVLLNIERSGNSNPLSLLNDIIKARTLGDINSVAKLDGFASIADKIMLLAKGDVPPAPLTTAELNSIGLTDVTDTNIAAIRSAIGASADDGTGVKSVNQLKDIQTAYLKVLALADLNRGNTTDTSKIPTVSDLQTLGVTLGKAGNTNDSQQTNALKLLNDVMDGLNSTGVDTVAEISALAASIDKVMGIATAPTSAAANAFGLAVSELTALGVTSATTDNLAQVVEAIRLTQSTDGSKVNTFKQMQSAVDLGVIMQYAESSTTASTGHVAPTVGQYLSAGLSSVDVGTNKAINNTNLSAINSAVEALQASNVNSLSKLQTVVNTYAKLLSMADGTKANTSDALTLADYLGIGALTRFDGNTGAVDGALTAKAVTTDSAQKEAALTLLNDVIDGRNTNQVDSIAEINLLSVAVDKVLDQALTTPSTTLKVNDFALLGIQNVNDTNLAQVVTNLKAASDNHTNGDTIDTLAEIQSNVSLAALQLYADNPANALPTQTNTLTQLYKDLILNTTSINWTDNLATSVSSVVNFLGKSDITTTKLQSVATAYQSVLLEATGDISNNNPNPTAAQYKEILKLPTETSVIHLYETATDDTTITNLNSNALALLNDVVKHKNANQLTSLNTLEIYARSVDKLMNLTEAADTTNSQLTITDLSNLGFNVNNAWGSSSTPGVNGFSNKVAQYDDHGASIRTWEQVQTLINQNSVF